LLQSPACSASQTHDEESLSDTTIRSLVRRHGQIIGQAEQAEVAAVATRDDLATLGMKLVPHEQPRRRPRFASRTERSHRRSIGA
jgi:hypothetical protein